MIYNPDKHQRRSIRLKNYDYTQDGLYFITICVHQRTCLFGEIYDGKMNLNVFGEIADNFWREIPGHFPAVKISEYIIMPNHIHGIIQLLTENNNCKDTACRVPTDKSTESKSSAYRTPTAEQYGKPVKGSIPTIVRSYKSVVTKKINELRQTLGAILWQKNYFEHIIRNEKSYYKIGEYIRNNPARWEDDRLYDIKL